MNHLKIVSGPIPNEATVELDGQEISSKISKIEFIGEVGRVNQVALVLSRPGIDFEVDAEVTILVQQDPKHAMKLAVAFLKTLDPKMLEEAALERLGWGGNQSMVKSTLGVLAEMMENAADQS